jgi:hypothetical protein
LELKLTCVIFDGENFLKGLAQAFLKEPFIGVGLYFDEVRQIYNLGGSGIADSLSFAAFNDMSH